MEDAVARHGRGVDQRAQQGTLPRTVRAEDADAVVSSQREVHVAQEIAFAGADDRALDAKHRRHRSARLLHVEMAAEPAFEVIVCRLGLDSLESMVDQPDLPRPRFLGRAPARSLERAARGAVMWPLHPFAGAHLGGGL